MRELLQDHVNRLHRRALCYLRPYAPLVEAGVPMRIRRPRLRTPGTDVTGTEFSEVAFRATHTQDQLDEFARVEEEANRRHTEQNRGRHAADAE